MKFQVVLSLALFAGAKAALKVESSQHTQKLNAVAKVIGLLNEMKTQIEKEAAEDADMYEKLGCWCTTNKEEKTAAVEAADARITDLTAAIPAAAAKVAQLDVEIKQLTKEAKANTEALEEATGIRAKEQEEYRTNEKDMISSLASLKNAIGVMSKSLWFSFGMSSITT
jgi:chromosome segregation ATPase